MANFRQEISLAEEEAVTVRVRNTAAVDLVVQQLTFDFFPSEDAWEMVQSVGGEYFFEPSTLLIEVGRPDYNKWLLVQTQLFDHTGVKEVGRYIITRRQEQWTEPAISVPGLVLLKIIFEDGRPIYTDEAVTPEAEFDIDEAGLAIDTEVPRTLGAVIQETGVLVYGEF